MWLRYIDDLFIVWDGSRELLEKFMICLEHNSMNLKFTMSCTQSQIIFLDVEVRDSESYCLTSDLFRKPTAGYSILHYMCFHPKPLLNSIPISQYFHLRRICSGEDVFKKQTSELCKRLKARGYKNKCLARAYNNNINKFRQQLLFKLKSPPTSSETTCFITMYSVQHADVRTILQRHWHFMLADSCLKLHISKDPIACIRL